MSHIICMCGCLSADLDDWEYDDLEDGTTRGMNARSFASVLKRLQDACTEISGLSAFQGSALAAVHPSDFSVIAIDAKSAQGASLQRRGESRTSVTPHSRGSKSSQKEEIRQEAGDLRSIEAGMQLFLPNLHRYANLTFIVAVLQFFESKDTRSLLTFYTGGSGNTSDETSLFALISPALQKSAEYIQALVNEDIVLPDSVFVTAESLGSECLSMNLLDAQLQDMFPTVYLRSVLFISYKHVHANRMRQEHLAIFDGSNSWQSVKFVYFCKQQNVCISSASMIIDGGVLLFGVIGSAVIKSTISFMHDLWRPLMDVDRCVWGSLDFEHMQDFFHAREAVTDLLFKTFRENASGIRLAFPDESLEIDRVPLHRDAINVELQRILSEVVTSWSDDIDTALAHSDAFFKDSSLPPFEEIDYWMNRCDVLCVITEQLKVRERRHCAALLGVVENKPAMVVVKRFRHAEKALAENLTEALDTKSQLKPLEEIVLTMQRGNIAEVLETIPRLMDAIAALALSCRRYGPGSPITLFLCKFSGSIERCIVVYLRGDFVSTAVMFWSHPASEIMELLVNSITCIDQYTKAVHACRVKIHGQQVASMSQNYSAASKAPLPAAIQEDVACHNLSKLKLMLINLKTALQWHMLFTNCRQLHDVSNLQQFFDNFHSTVTKLMSIDLGDLFDVHSTQMLEVLARMRPAKDALFEACLTHINVELHDSDSVNKKIDILEMHGDVLEQAGPAATAMVAEHSLVIVQVSVA